MQFPTDFRPRAFGFVTAAGLLAACLLASCKKPGGPPPPPPAPVSVLNPIERDVVDWDEFTGRMEATDSVDVKARVSGMLETANFVEGSDVEKGQVLFKLDRRPFEAALKQAQGDLERAQAQFALAEVEFKRLEELKDTAAVSGTEYETQREKVAQGRAAITSAQGALSVAQLNLDWSEVKAEITGKISKKLVTPGNWVNGGVVQATLLTTIKSEAPIYCYINADEISLLKYQRLATEKQITTAADARIPAYLSLADEKAFDRKGMLDFVDNKLNFNTGTLNARAVFANKDKFLKDGMFGRVRIPSGAQYRAILIPTEAIGTDQAQKFVFVVDDQGVAKPRPVKLGADFGGFRVVTSGLSTSDRVIVNGLMKVRPGAHVKAEPAPWPDRPMNLAPAAAPGATTQPTTAPATAPTTAPTTARQAGATFAPALEGGAR